MMKLDKHFSPLQGRVAKLAAMSLPAAVLLLNVVGSAHAASVVFDYNSSSLYNLSTNAPSSGADNSGTPSTGVEGYMDSKLHVYDPNWNVTVYGAESSGSNTGGGYVGDSHVVYCATAAKSCTTSKEANLSNLYSLPFIETSGAFTSAPGNSGKSAIEMAFSGKTGDPVKVTSLSFAFEIFPDASCANGQSNCTVPDFTFILQSGASTIINATVAGIDPKTGVSGGATTVTDSNGSYNISCTVPTNKSPSLNPETADQCTGTMSFVFNTAISNPTLYFVDWPADVAVTNIDWGIPEPGSLALLGGGLLGLGLIRRRRRN